MLIAWGDRPICQIPSWHSTFRTAVLGRPASHVGGVFYAQQSNPHRYYLFGLVHVLIVGFRTEGTRNGWRFQRNDHYSYLALEHSWSSHAANDDDLQRQGSYRRTSVAGRCQSRRQVLRRKNNSGDLFGVHGLEREFQPDVRAE